MTKRFILNNKNRVEQVQEIKDYIINLPETSWEVVIRKPTRTTAQNKAMHLFFSWVQEALNDKGLTLQKVLKLDMETDWSGNMVKDILWRPTQRILTKKESTASLTTKEVTEIAEVIQRALAVKGVSVNFPSMESKLRGEKNYENV